MSAAVHRAHACPAHARVVELAAHEVRSTPDSFVAAPSGERPRAFCDIVEQGGQRSAGTGA